MSRVVFLRGVNVGGHRTFRPTAVTEALDEFDVVNVGAAGTFAVRGRVTEARLRSAIARLVPFDTDVMVCRGGELLALAASDPFRGLPASSDVVRFVGVLARRPRAAPSLPVALPPSGRWLLKIVSRRERFVLGFYRREMKVIRYLSQLDMVFGVPATVRNWNTIVAVARLLDRSLDAEYRPTAPRASRRA